jgi:hypothetical protein
MLEQKIEALTAAVAALTVAMTTAREAAPAAKKASAIQAVAAAEAAVVAATRYWKIPEHNTAYLQKPGDMPLSTDKGVEISREEYDAYVLELAVKFPKPVATVAAVSAPIASSNGAAPSLAELTAKFQALVKAKGPGAMKAVLAQFGATLISGLAGKDLAAVAAAIEAA